MSLEHDTTMESVTQPDETKDPARSTPYSDQANKSKEPALEEDPKPQSKAKGKRPLSSSLSPPSAKRPALSPSDDTPSFKKSYAYTDLSQTEPQDEPATDNQDANPQTIQLTYHIGDIFDAPPRTLLIHACNTQGHWGAGIAKSFKTIYTKAYQLHHRFCAKEHTKANPVPTGTAQLIAPMEGDEDGHWIGCLFTSAKYGKAKDKPAQIVKNSVESMEQLLEMVKMADEERGNGKGVDVIRMCKINSGKFGVPWEKTEEVLKGIVLQEGWRRIVEVWEPEE